MATSPTSGTSVAVFDASVLLRVLVDDVPDANGWLDRVAAGEVVPAWPSHPYAEVADALLALVRAERVGPRRSGEVLDLVRSAPARVHPVRELTREALRVTLARELSVYDALYVVVAEARGAPPVTVDRKLAAATANAIALS